MMKQVVKRVAKRGLREISSLSGGVAGVIRSRGIPLTPGDIRLLSLKDIHKGRRAFIIGNGPSLKIEMLDRLQKEVTFGMNQLFRCFDQTPWRPTYYALTDSLVVENFGAEICRLFSGKFLLSDHLSTNMPAESDSFIFRKTHEYYEIEEPDFSSNAMYRCIGGYTTAYFCMQIAWYMGIRKFYTLGIDASYNFESTPTVERLGQFEVIESLGHSNWFIPSYFSENTKLIKPKVLQQILAYRAARRFMEKNAGEIYNAAPESPMDVFPRVDFQRLI